MTRTKRRHRRQKLTRRKRQRGGSEYSWINAYIAKLDWDKLSQNPGAIELLQSYPDKIDWRYLSANPGAIEMLKDNPDKIDWNFLSSNPNVIEVVGISNMNELFLPQFRD